MDRLDSLCALFTRFMFLPSAMLLISIASTSPLIGADPAQADQPAKSEEKGGEAPAEKKSVPFPDPPIPGLKRLAPKADVWIDLPNKQIVLGGEVVLRRGPLELLACLKHTKEHEAVFAIETKAYIVHAGLLAVGATVGNPAKFLPEYTPARGTEVEVTVEWTDAAGKKQKKDARQFIKNAKTGEAMTFPWVFGGSGFWVDPADNSKHYQAEDGDLICISNFPSAMLDVPVESSNANAALLFEAFTDNIPPEKTKVLIYLKPKLAKPAAGHKPEEKPAPPKSNSVSAAGVKPGSSIAVVPD